MDNLFFPEIVAGTKDFGLEGKLLKIFDDGGLLLFCLGELEFCLEDDLPFEDKVDCMWELFDFIYNLIFAVFFEFEVGQNG
jgi:hypothetical protein